MIKTVLKEVIIVLVLCIAILLVLSVLFYDYNPVSKVVPNKVAYSTPNDIVEDLQEENSVEEITVENKIYTIEGSDLNIYKKSNSYTPGKANPFASSPTNTQNTNTTSGTTQQPGQTSGNTSNTQPATNQNNVATQQPAAQAANNTTFWNTTGSK